MSPEIYKEKYFSRQQKNAHLRETILLQDMSPEIFKEKYFSRPRKNAQLRETILLQDMSPEICKEKYYWRPGKTAHWRVAILLQGMSPEIHKEKYLSSPRKNAQLRETNLLQDMLQVIRGFPNWKSRVFITYIGEYQISIWLGAVPFNADFPSKQLKKRWATLNSTQVENLKRFLTRLLELHCKMCQKSSREGNMTNKSDALHVYYIILSSKTVLVDINSCLWW